MSIWERAREWLLCKPFASYINPALRAASIAMGSKKSIPPWAMRRIRVWNCACAIVEPLVALRVLQYRRQLRYYDKKDQERAHGR